MHLSPVFTFPILTSNSKLIYLYRTVLNYTNCLPPSCCPPANCNTVMLSTLTVWSCHFKHNFFTFANNCFHRYHFTHTLKFIVSSLHHIIFLSTLQIGLPIRNMSPLLLPSTLILMECFSIGVTALSRSLS